MLNKMAFTAFKPVSFTAKNNDKKVSGHKPKRAGITKTTALVGLTALSSIGMAQVAKANNDSTAINADSTKAGLVSQDLVFNQKCEDAILEVQKKLGLNADSAEIAELRTFVENNQDLIKKIMEAESPEEVEKLVDKAMKKDNNEPKAAIIALLVVLGSAAGSWGLVKLADYCDSKGIS